MRAAEYELRADERTRFEQELFMPLVAIVSIAVIVLYATSSTVPGQFAGRGIHISIGAAIGALCVLLLVWCVNQQRTRKYAINDEGISMQLPIITYTIPYSEIVEVVSVADRRPQPILKAVSSGSLKRAAFSLTSLSKRLSGVTTAPLAPETDYNFTTSDTGGARIVCRNGARALVSPMELSNFLRHLEAEFNERGLDARVVREVPVQIQRS